MMTIDMFHHPLWIKRGDLIHTAVGTKRERTWLVLHAHRVKPFDRIPTRFKVWAVRWWELDAGIRMKLFRSAQRNGGQRCIEVVAYNRKKKNPSFEEFMRRSI